MKKTFFLCILYLFCFGVSADAQTSKTFMDFENKQIKIIAFEEIVSIGVEGKKAQQFVWDKDQYGAPDDILINDYNFDGFKDVMVYASDGTVNSFCRIYVFLPAQKIFKEARLKPESKKLISGGVLCNVKVLPDLERLSSSCRLSATEYAYEELKFTDDGQLYICSTNSQDDDATLILEDSIFGLIHKINSPYFDDIYDSLELWNPSLEQNIMEFAKRQSGFLSKDLVTWDDEGINVVTSSDKKLRIIYWNKQTSGTLREYRVLAFWQNSNGSLEMKPLDEFENASFARVLTFQRKNKQPFYILSGMAHGSNREKVDFISAYEILGSELKPAQIFKTPSKSLETISFYLDMASVESDDDLIHFSADKKIIYVPIVNEEGQIKQGHFLIYKFDGTRFVYSGEKK